MLLAIDLYAGLGGWAEGFLVEGYSVIGFDIERRSYPSQLVLQDVRTLHGSQFKDATVIVGSSPCQEFSYRAMPFKRGKALGPPLLGIELFQTQFRIQKEASEAAGRYIPMVVENVRGAQPWVGRAAWHYGSYYLFGDVPAIMPTTLFRPSQKGHVHAYEWLRTTVAAFKDDPALPWDTYPCVEWPYSLKGVGYATGDAYGQVYRDGKLRGAHREAWILANGEIPEDLHVLHRCDVRPCIRPSHLFLGDCADNLLDCSLKGRMHPGEENPGAKLTEAEVIEIRTRVAGGETQRAMALAFGVSTTAIWKIINGLKWNPRTVDDGVKLPGNGSARMWRDRELPRLNAVNKHKDGYTVAIEDAIKLRSLDGGRRHGSHSEARKAASAQIAKIPYELALHIAKVFKP